MKKITVLIFTIFLASCTTTDNVVIQQVYVPYNVPTTLFNCPQIKIRDFPNPDSATNRELSEFIAKLYRYNKTCGVNMTAIKRYIDAVEKRLQEDKTKK